MALHIAASGGCVDVMKEVLSRCPDCLEIHNSSGQNILHIAVECEEEKAIKFILENSFPSSLINRKDIDGNTPLHLLAASSSYYKYGLKKHPAVDIMAYNKNNLTTRDIEWGNHSGEIEAGSGKKFKLPKKMKVFRKKDEEDRDLKKIMETKLIVATLIATVTFAPGFTVPGGYDGNNGPNQGMAVLARRAAFVAFVVTESIGMVFSITYVFIHLFAYFHTNKEKSANGYFTALVLTLAAMVAMLVAFMTGL